MPDTDPKSAAETSVGRGFARPVFDSQAVFAAAMRALSQPGAPVDFGARIVGPRGLEPAAASLLAALADYDTPVWLDATLAGDGDVARWIGFQTGAVIVKDPGLARFGVASAHAPLPNLSEFALGTADYPDRSTTLLVTVDALESGTSLGLAGPGIETTATIAPRGLSPVFLADWAINTALFPRGIDVFLVAGTRAIGLPRTTRIGRR